MLDRLYTHIARKRRRYYEKRPHLRRRLAAPVVSIGNLTVGGSGKTPLAAAIARQLVAAGERPSILSRGYGRQIKEDGVVIVSDGASVLSDVAHAGDEPMMLAHGVPGAAVLVSSSRYAAGRIAEARLGCTVHILDDGFQHFDLMRDVDLLVAPEAADERTLPAGRLREPLDAARAADALLVEVDAAALARQTPTGTAAVDARPTFVFSRRLAAPPPEAPAFAFAGVARPERFFTALERAGWRLTGQRRFRDHHRYSRADVESLARTARDSGASVLLTTEKDMVRLTPGVLAGVDAQIVAIPMEIVIEPAFYPWLAARLAAARLSRH